jgi:hypothetical protein
MSAKRYRYTDVIVFLDTDTFGLARQAEELVRTVGNVLDIDIDGIEFEVEADDLWDLHEMLTSLVENLETLSIDYKPHKEHVEVVPA